MEYIAESDNRRLHLTPFNRKLFELMLITFCILSSLFMLFFSAKLFTQPDKISDVTLKAKQAAYPENTAQIALLFINRSRYPVTYYDAYLIERKNNNKWEKIEASYAPPSSRRHATKELGPNCELELLILATFPHSYLPIGEYRISLAVDKNSNGDISEAFPLYAEFSIVETTIRL
jgi:hypothetical protein